MDKPINTVLEWSVINNTKRVSEALMESNAIQSKVLRGFLLIISSMCLGTYSDFGKISSPQNHFGIVTQSQFATRNNSRIIVQKGGLAILPCVVKINSPAVVSWIRRSDFQLLTVGLSTHSSDKRFLVEHARHMGHWSLRIKSVREADRGFYECQLSIYPTQSIFIELKIVEAVAEISGSPDLHIDESSTLRLECQLRRATENPAFVFWYHNNKMVNYDSQDGFSVTSSAENISHSLDKSILSMGRDMNKIFSNLTTLTHLKVTQQQQQQQQQQSSSSFLLTPATSYLTIQEVHFHHAGNYTCAPSNARPSSITVHVLRGDKPAAMQHANRTVLESETNNSSFGTSNNAYGFKFKDRSAICGYHVAFIQLFQLKPRCMNLFYFIAYSWLTSVALLLGTFKVYR